MMTTCPPKVNIIAYITIYS